jgi:hypothetical protein
MIVPLKSSPILAKIDRPLSFIFLGVGIKFNELLKNTENQKNVNAFMQFRRASYIGNSKIALGPLTHLFLAVAADPVLIAI